MGAWMGLDPSFPITDLLQVTWLWLSSFLQTQSSPVDIHAIVHYLSWSAFYIPIQGSSSLNRRKKKYVFCGIEMEESQFS